MRLLASLALLLALAAPRAGRAEPVAQATEEAAPAPPAAPGSGAIAPTAAVAARLAEGDRLAQAGDPRGALFAYLDGAYAQPEYLPARVKVGRAYLALRYPARAIQQAEMVLAASPGDVEARKLLEEARAASARIGASPQAAAAAGGTVAGGAPPPPDLQTAVAPAAAATTERPQVSRSGAQHYRVALGMLQDREWARAIAELTLAVEADPRLAVAYSARGSARFGLGKYREAAEDYRQAIALDPNLGTPLYGLAECYRQLGDRASALESYERYAESKAPDVRDDLRALAVKRARELREPASVRPPG